jgi:hypothetical protein
MPGDAADDAWEASFQSESDAKDIKRGLQLRCTLAPVVCEGHKAFYNDDGLWECPKCHQMIDL